MSTISSTGVRSLVGRLATFHFAAESGGPAESIAPGAEAAPVTLQVTRPGHAPSLASLEGDRDAGPIDESAGGEYLDDRIRLSE